MKQFRDFGIKPTVSGFSGDKIKIDRIVNREITVYDYKVEPSKFKEKGNGKCLHMQIGIGDNKHVVFSGSSVLMNTIQQIQRENFPFKTTIIKDNDHYTFT